MLTFSFVICTFENSGREDRIRQVVSELKRQRPYEYEVIIVYQGSDESLVPVATGDGVRVIMTSLCSSSERRNIGAAHARNEVISFLDDDTFPLSDSYCSDVERLIGSGELDFVVCNIHSSGDLQAGAPISADVDLDRKSIIGNLWEPGIAIRRTDFDRVKFDPTLGIGCVHGSSEGLDLGLRLLAAGLKGRRVASILIDHPPLEAGYQMRVERLFFYSLGNGSVLIQHKLYRVYALQLVKAVARLFLSLLKRDTVKASASLVRICCLVAGPILPRRAARVLPPAEIGRTTYAELNPAVVSTQG